MVGEKQLKLGDLLENKITKKNVSEDDLITFLPMEYVSVEGKIKKEQIVPYNKIKPGQGLTYFEDNDVIVAKITPSFENGKGAFLNGLKTNIGFGSTEFHVLRAKEGAVAEYIYHHTQSMRFRKELGTQMIGSAGQKRVPRYLIDEYTLPVEHSFKEQQAIAETLSDMDDFLESVEKLIDKKQKIKEGAMQEFLTGKRRLPGFTGKWKKVRLEKIGIFGSGNGFPIKYQNNKNDRYPFFKVSDMNHKKNPIYMKVANHYISDQIRKKISASVFPKGTIIFAKIGAAILLERKRILAQPSCIDNNMMGFTPDTDLCCNKLIYMMFINMELGHLAHTTALPSLSPNTVGAIELFIPQTIKEQQAIAQVLSDMDSDIEALEKKLNKYRAIKQGMMQELLTGRIRLI